MPKKSSNPQYQDAHRENLLAAISVRVYGVPLQNPSLEGYTAIWFCGVLVRNRDLRRCTKRILHIPQDRVVAAGEVDGFLFEEHQVHWFDVQIETTLVEEQYIPIPLKDEIREQQPSVLRRAQGGGLTACERACVETLNTCTRAILNVLAHPPELGWTDEQRAEELERCMEAFEICMDNCARIERPFGFPNL
jgi:hypothetical protein